MTEYIHRMHSIISITTIVKVLTITIISTCLVRLYNTREWPDTLIMFITFINYWNLCCAKMSSDINCVLTGRLSRSHSYHSLDTPPINLWTGRMSPSLMSAEPSPGFGASVLMGCLPEPLAFMHSIAVAISTHFWYQLNPPFISLDYNDAIGSAKQPTGCNNLPYTVLTQHSKLDCRHK